MHYFQSCETRVVILSNDVTIPAFQTLLNELGLFLIWNNGHRNICSGKLRRCKCIFRKKREKELFEGNAV